VYLKDITGTLGKELAGRKIALCVTSSISITEAPRIARLLMRHGAEIFSVMTPNAAELVSPMIFEWSTGNPPITKLSGRVEHVELVTSNRVDLVLIAPCTANTLGKIAGGICDDTVSTVLCTAMGAGIPILIASAMHEPMLKNPIVQESRSKLENLGVSFVDGSLEESKSKIATPEQILDKVISIIGSIAAKDPQSEINSNLSHSSFLVTAGATREPIDDVRYITNASTGKMGVALAEAALSRGAKKVCLINGPGVSITYALKNNPRAKIESVYTGEEMAKSVMDELSSGRYEVFISAAAVSDYVPSSTKGKLATLDHPVLDLKLVAAKKIVSTAKAMFPKTLVVAFKAEQGLDGEELMKRASDALTSSKVDIVVGNNVARKDIGFGSDYNEVYIVTKDGRQKHLPRAAKREIADGILDSLQEMIQ
jgi:phosphopantothenoylcysteine decarboxylase / phosphopantothenate---cysteine ligase